MVGKNYSVKIRINPETHLERFVEEEFTAPDDQTAKERTQKWMSVLGMCHSGINGVTEVRLESFINGNTSLHDRYPIYLKVTPMQKVLLWDAVDPTEKELLQYGFNPKNSGTGKYVK